MAWGEGRVHQGHEVCLIQQSDRQRLCRFVFSPLLHPAWVTWLLCVDGNRPGLSDFLCTGNAAFFAVLIDSPFRHTPFFRCLPERKIIFHSVTAFINTDSFRFYQLLYRNFRRVSSCGQTLKGYDSSREKRYREQIESDWRLQTPVFSGFLIAAVMRFFVLRESSFFLHGWQDLIQKKTLDLRKFPKSRAFFQINSLRTAWRYKSMIEYESP